MAKKNTRELKVRVINSEERLWRLLSGLNIIGVEVRTSWLKQVCILERYPLEERMKNRI